MCCTSEGKQGTNIMIQACYPAGLKERMMDHLKLQQAQTQGGDICHDKLPENIDIKWKIVSMHKGECVCNYGIKNIGADSDQKKWGGARKRSTCIPLSYRANILLKICSQNMKDIMTLTWKEARDILSPYLNKVHF